MSVNHLSYLTASKIPEYRSKNTPETCPVLGHSNLISVLDHDHQTGLVRGVLSLQGNVLLGKVENCFRSRCGVSNWPLPEVLRAMATFLEHAKTEILHPVGATQLTNRFKSKTSAEQHETLRELGVKLTDWDSLGNSDQRGKAFRDLITGKVKNETTSIVQAL